MLYRDVEDLFPEEGWREPSDDAGRLATYILAVICALVGVAGAVFMAMCAIDPTRIDSDPGKPTPSWQWIPFACFALLSAAMAVGSVYFLAKESRHWNLRGLNAERVVAGMFLFAFAVGIIAVWMLQGAGGEAVPVSAIILGVAVTLFLISLLVGLCVAGFQAISRRPRRLGQARILARYAVDDTLARIDDHPCPSEDGHTAIVEVEFVNGELAKFRAQPGAYELARVNSVGMLIGTRRTLTNFRSERVLR